MPCVPSPLLQGERVRVRGSYEMGAFQFFSVSSVFSVVNILDAPNKSGHDA